MWTAQHYGFPAPRRWINSGGLGTMGFGLPAAIGAQIGCPDQLVVVVAGDGSLQMNSQEFATVVQEGLPIKVFILNNGFLGMVRQWQELFWDNRYSHVDLKEHSPDWVKLADAYGLRGVQLTQKESLVEDMKAVLAMDGPVICDVLVTREENTYPMIPAGEPAPQKSSKGSDGSAVSPSFSISAPRGAFVGQ
jgi:acetolactate synthase-1/2/3 large subunit